MYIGTLVMAPKGTAGTSTYYYTPWMPRQAQNAWFTYQLIQSLLASGGVFAIVPYHKNREDRGDEGTAVSGSFTEIVSGTGFYQMKCEGLKELVRFKIEVKVGGGGYPEGAVYRLLAAMWYDKAV
ncbi:MAG: hypothetical protein IPK26_23900 [Planctomycetes bacterium]|nr:hypothetical protein [Planctomycetota bacterium]